MKNACWKGEKTEEKVVLYCKYYDKNQQEERTLTLVTFSGISHVLWIHPWKKIFPNVSNMERCISSSHPFSHWKDLFQWKKVSSCPSWWTLTGIRALEGTESSIIQCISVIQGFNMWHSAIIVSDLNFF